VLYHLLVPLAEYHIIFNLFRFQTFRAAGAVVTAFLVAFYFGPPIIRRLRMLKVGQVVRTEGPQTHLGKSGTPTMGGVLIVLATVIPTLLWAELDNRTRSPRWWCCSGSARSASWTTTSRSSARRRRA
jgi:phospho-N-acetylmuramoyl-pentapeptide-transferase